MSRTILFFTSWPDPALSRDLRIANVAHRIHNWYVGPNSRKWTSLDAVWTLGFVSSRTSRSRIDDMRSRTFQLFTTLWPKYIAQLLRGVESRMLVLTFEVVSSCRIQIVTHNVLLSVPMAIVNPHVSITAGTSDKASQLIRRVCVTLTKRGGFWFMSVGSPFSSLRLITIIVFFGCAISFVRVRCTLSDIVPLVCWCLVSGVRTN